MLSQLYLSKEPLRNLFFHPFPLTEMNHHIGPLQSRYYGTFKHLCLLCLQKDPQERFSLVLFVAYLSYDAMLIFPYREGLFQTLTRMKSLLLRRYHSFLFSKLFILVRVVVEPESIPETLGCEVGIHLEWETHSFLHVCVWKVGGNRRNQRTLENPAGTHVDIRKTSKTPPRQ